MDDAALAKDFSSLFEFLPIGAYRSRADGTPVRVNSALVRLIGHASEAEMLHGAREAPAGWYVDPLRRAQFRALLDRDGSVVAFESEIWRQRPRERIWISENAHVVRGAQGRVLYMEGTAEDITDRRLARDALRASEAQLQQIVSLVPGMVYRMVVLPSGQRRATFVSDGSRQVFKVEPEAVLADGALMHKLRHPEDRARIAAETRAATRAGRPLQTEHRVLLPTGEVKWVQVVSTNAPPEDGNQVRVGVFFDITQRKLADQALLDNSELWKRALESSGDGVWDWHVQAGVEVLSAKCKALYGWGADELPDTPDALDGLTHPDDVPGMQQARSEHFAGRTPAYVNEHRVRCKDGQWKWILSRGIVISRDAAGLPLRVIGTHTDITASRQSEALRIERDRAAAANLAKSQFLSRVSHELRTPLNGILGFAQLLELDPAATERQRGWTAHVLASGRHLLALMNDILDLSSAQTGQLRVSTEATLLIPVVDEVLAMLAGTAQEAGVRVVLALPPAPWLHVMVDRKRCKQIVSNLLSNAIKYNRPGGWVKLSTAMEPDAVLLTVQDNGAGMDATQLEALFQPFERLGAERGPVAGTGLGLALSRQLAEAMGGDISVQSEPGTGSTFSLRLPRV